MAERIIIDDSNENWRAVIEFYKKVAMLSFEKKPYGGTVQGYVDDTLGCDNIQTGINDLEVLPDDGSFIVDFQDYSDEQVQTIKQPLIEYFTKLYEDNKSKFSKNIKKDIKAYEKVVKEREISTCQSCGCYRHIDAHPLTVAQKYGTEADGTQSRDYCINCYQNGAFTEDLTIEQIAEKCITTWANSFTEARKKQLIMDILPNLKRWKNEIDR